MGILHEVLLDFNKRLETEESLYSPPLSLSKPFGPLSSSSQQLVTTSVSSLCVIRESHGGICRSG